MLAENITSLPTSLQNRILSGTVKTIDDQLYTIQSGKELFTASLAFSCVVKPELDDNVLFSDSQNQPAHVLAILQRNRESPVVMSFQGDVQINSEQGKISLAGQSGIQLASGKSLSMVAEDLHIHAKQGLMSLQQVRLVGDTLTSCFKNISSFSKSVETITHRISQKCTHSIRLIRGMDQTSAGEVLTSVKNMFSLRSRQAILLARKDMKMDAERIHMG